jgi:hypothetical protein
VNYPERYNPRGKVPTNIWEMVTPTQGSWGDGNIDHPAPFPPEMVERIISLTTDKDDVVFDPFAGSGTVLAQAEAMERLPIGFELSETYSEMYQTLREDIISDWEERQQEGDTLERRQEILQETICKLRQLNYPRELTRRVRKDLDADNLESLKINTAIQLSHEIVDHEKFDKDHLFMEDDLYLVVDNDTSQEQIKNIRETAEKNSQEAPCSKFGIVANIEVVSVGELMSIMENSEWQNKWANEDYYLYSNDIQNAFEMEIDLDTWVSRVSNPQKWRENTSKNHYPAIISNIRISVDEPDDEWGNNNSASDTTKLTDF